MPAPDFGTLYDLETAFETAAKTVLADFGIAAFTQMEVENLPASRVDVQCHIGDLTGHKSQVTPGQFAFDAWNGSLSFMITTPRRVPSDPEYDAQAHGKMRGRVRQAIQYFSNRFTAEVLPYHVLVSIRESGTDPSVLINDDSDLSTLSCACVFAIRTGAWPA